MITERKYMPKLRKVIKNISEVEKAGVEYATCDSLQSRWFEICKSNDGYSIYGYICGQNPTYVSNGNNMTYWKTWSGVIRAIHRFAKNGSWGFGMFFPNDKEVT